MGKKSKCLNPFVPLETPCPFCGMDMGHLVREVDGHEFTCYFVTCPSCGARGPEVPRKAMVGDEASAIEALRKWESRK